MIAGSKSDDAPPALFCRKLQQAVGGAPQLEGAARLQAFAFQPQASALERALDQRGLLDKTFDARASLDDVLARDLCPFS